MTTKVVIPEGNNFRPNYLCIVHEAKAAGIEISDTLDSALAIENLRESQDRQRLVDLLCRHKNLDQPVTVTDQSNVTQTMILPKEERINLNIRDLNPGKELWAEEGIYAIVTNNNRGLVSLHCSQGKSSATITFHEERITITHALSNTSIVSVYDVEGELEHALTHNPDHRRQTLSLTRITELLYGDTDITEQNSTDLYSQIEDIIYNDLI